MIYLTKKVSFSASHRLYNPAFSDAENKKIYGMCSNPNGHGHNYELEVTIRGVPDPETGMIIDLKLLKSVLYEEIIRKVDHKHLNHDVPFMNGAIPTVENILIKFWEILQDKFDHCELHELKLYETRDNHAVYRGE